ncbi:MULTISPECIES: ABC transporter permease [Microbacterium]|jgi:peptide/nickel transport system permease protein|uniref:ABC transporter permease n=2 Tax=Microbacterium maritypicum TaxID=33918 RepID=A0ACD4B2H3_MICMQ|nr:MULTISPECIES: ABC transporter permease [Microbacterium]AZS47759.1 Oligopeptide transport system permease protein OppC [Microbacterium oxydans]EYT61228.1 ABC transporter permease [Microbacterium sp. UCD-TDU]KAB1886859.1 ABC transporter permease [Microbacterium liquefaciens]KQV01730.1 ABC transporter permease [Microbacterium sp. Root322]UTT51790.1 ABC transporter permease [Microbacterium liquefaciens]
MSDTKNPLLTQEPPITAPASTISLATQQGRKRRRILPSTSPKFIVGAIIVVAIVLFAIIAPMFSQDPRSTANPALQPPSAEHWLGTTKLGNDMFAQLAIGAQGSLLIGVTAGAIAIVLSLLFGVLAGYLGGWREDGLALLTNVMIVIPGLPLVMVIASFVPQRSWQLVAFVLGITSWAGAAYVLRLQTRSLRTRDYVYAAKVAGERSFRVILVEIMPNLLPLLAAQFLFAIIFAILGEAGLSYLGLGPNSSITWGSILNDAQSGQALGRGAWWWFVPPGLMIALLGAGLSLINFAIDEVINPKLRNAPEAARRVRKAAKTKGVTA